MKFTTQKRRSILNWSKTSLGTRLWQQQKKKPRQKKLIKSVWISFWILTHFTVVKSFKWTQNDEETDGRLFHLPLSLSLSSLFVFKHILNFEKVHKRSERERKKANTHRQICCLAKCKLCVCRTLHSVSRIEWGYWLCYLSFLVGRIFVFLLYFQCVLLVSKTDHITETAISKNVHAYARAFTHKHMAKLSHFRFPHLQMYQHTQTHTGRFVRTQSYWWVCLRYSIHFVCLVWICIGMHIWCCCNILYFFVWDCCVYNKHSLLFLLSLSLLISIFSSSSFSSSLLSFSLSLAQFVRCYFGVTFTLACKLNAINDIVSIPFHKYYHIVRWSGIAWHGLSYICIVNAELNC